MSLPHHVQHYMFPLKYHISPREDESWVQKMHTVIVYCCKNVEFKFNLTMHGKSLPCKFIVTTPTQPQLNSKVGFYMKMTLHHQHTNSMSSISQLFLTQFQPNFKGRFVGSTTTITTTTWTTATTTTTKATFYLLLTRFWRNSNGT